MLSLQSDGSSLVLAPEIGGAIVGWSIGTTPLLRRPQPEAIMRGDVRGFGCFALIPFSNRIGRRGFRWDGRDYDLEPNFGDHPHCIHGIGWHSQWTVAAVSAASAILTLHHDASGPRARRWPFAFMAEQRFKLLTDRLQVTLSLTNLHPDPAPGGLGLHPYFPHAGKAKLRFAAKQVWQNGEDMLPVQCIAIPADWDHASGKRIDGAALDNCFSGWDGRAHITWGADRPAISIEAGDLFRQLIVYTPPAHDYFCVEPVSHVTDAINRMDADPALGMQILQPGATLQGAVTFRVTTRG
jgi:aldose 1-epimerase